MNKGYKVERNNPRLRSRLILASLALCSFALLMFVLSYLNWLKGEGNKVDTTKLLIKNLESVLDDYKRVCGQYPTTDQSLSALIHPPASNPICKNYPSKGFWLYKDPPEDAFGNQFIYKSDGHSYVIISLGQDAKPGGTGANADISSVDIP